MTTTHAKPGRKPNGRAELDALLKCSEAFDEARARSAKEKRPVEFVLPGSDQIVGVATSAQLIKPKFARTLWAWPDGTVTSPDSLRQRMRNLKFRRAKHGEVMTGLNHPVVVHNDL